MATDPKKYTYHAFISYSHRDKMWGDWLHKALESYRVPKALVGSPTERKDSVPARVYPIFRDREELPTSSNLGQVINRALAESRYLIVICSPHAARSRWVNEEILQFKRLGREDRILALIVDGEPNAGDGKPGFPADDECFPDALQFRLGATGALSTDRTEPIAADSRPDKDGKANALLKLLAGVLGVAYDALKRRDETRRKQRQRLVLSSALGLILFFAGISAVALWQWREAEVQRAEAERQTERAERGEEEALAQRDQAREEEGHAWLERARTKALEGDFMTAALFSAKAVGFSGLGRESMENGKLLNGHPLLLTSDNAPHEFAEAVDLVERIRSAESGLLVWRSPINAHHSGEVTSVAFSPDARWLASGSGDKTLKLWEVEFGEQTLNFEGHSQGITSIAFSPDGSRLASGSRDSTIKVWEADSGRELITLTVHSDVITTVTFSPDGRWLASGSRDRTIKVSDVEDGRELMTLIGHSWINSIAFSPGGRWLASGSSDKMIKVWEVKTGRELTTLAGHSGDVTSVAFSPDGRWLASSSHDRSIKIWEVETWQELATWTGHKKWVDCVAFSPDGRWLASGSRDSTIRIWEVKSGKELVSLTGYPGGGVAFSPDGIRLASGSQDRTIKIWDVHSGREVRNWSGHSGGVTSVDISPDGRLLASGSRDQEIIIWDSGSGRQVTLLSGHSGAVHSVAFSPDGRWLASSSDDDTIRIWEVTSGQELITLTGHEPHVTCVAFSPDGSKLASSGSLDETIKVWEVVSGRELMTLTGHAEGVTSVAFSPDGRWLASGSFDQMIKIWDAETGHESASFIDHSGTISCFAFSPDSSRLASGSLTGQINLWEVEGGQLLGTVDARYNSSVQCVAFSPCGNRLAAGSSKVIKMWDVSTNRGRQLANWTGHLGNVTSVVFSPNGRHLISGSEDGTVGLWELGTDWELASLRGHSSSVAFSPNGTHLASGSENTIKMWDVRTGRELTVLDGHSGFVSSVAFSPVGRIASGSHDSTIKIWQAESGRELTTLTGHSNAVTSVAFSSDGSKLASGSHDQMIKVWDVESGRELASLTGHSGTVTCVAFSTDRSRLASGSQDRTIKIWEVKSGRELENLTGHLGEITSIAVSPDGRRLASSSSDQTIRIWDVESGRQLLTISEDRKFPFANVVKSVAFGPDGSQLASGDQSGTVRIWEVASGRELARLRRPSDSLVQSVEFSPDGKFLAAAYSDHMIRLWTVNGENTPSLDLFSILSGELFELNRTSLQVHQLIATNLYQNRQVAIAQPNWNIRNALTQLLLLQNIPAAFAVAEGEEVVTVIRGALASVAADLTKSGLHFRAARNWTALKPHLKEADFTDPAMSLAALRLYAICLRTPDFKMSDEIVGVLTRARSEAWQTMAALEGSDALAQQGDILFDQGQLAEALQAYRDSLEIMERLAAQDPDNAGLQRDLSVRHNKVGDVLVAQGQFAEALKVYRDSLENRERLAVQDPDNAGWQSDLSFGYDNVGDVLVAQGELADALKAYRSSLEVRERLAAHYPNYAGGQRVFSVSLTKIADLHERSQNYSAALEYWEQALENSGWLARGFPDVPQFASDLEYIRRRHAEVSQRIESAREAALNRVEVYGPLKFSGELKSGSQPSRSGAWIANHPFAGQSGDRVVIDLRSGEFDTFLILTSASGQAWENDDWEGSTKHSRIELTLPETGEYTVTVTSFEAGEIGPYTLEISGRRVVTEAALNRMEVYGPLKFGGELKSGSQPLKTGRWSAIHRFAGQSGDRVVIDLRSGEFDTFLILTSASGQAWENDDWEGSLDHSRIELTLPETGEYTVTVTSYEAGETGPYTLEISGRRVVTEEKAGEAENSP